MKDDTTFPLTELTKEQLIGHIRRLERKFEETRPEEQKRLYERANLYEREAFRVGKLLDRICGVLLHHKLLPQNEEEIPSVISRLFCENIRLQEELAKLKGGI